MAPEKWWLRDYIFSFWDGNFSNDMLVPGRVKNHPSEKENHLNAPPFLGPKLLQHQTRNTKKGGDEVASKHRERINRPCVKC